MIKKIGQLIKALIHKLAYHCDCIGLELKRRNWGKTRLGRAFVDVILYPADIHKIAMRYRNTFGRFPRLIRPKTFNEWLQVSKLVRRKSLYQQFADKVLVRDFVREKVGDDVLTQILWSGTDILEARNIALPKRFVIKANNGSGTNIIVTDSAGLDWQHVCAVTREWLTHDQSIPFAEWQYRWIEPRLLIEEYLAGPDGQVPIDYKFFCFYGVVRLIQVDFDRFEKHTRLLFDHNFVLLPVGLQYPRVVREIGKPACFDRMIAIAEALSANEPFLRVDLYDVGTPKFGELTLHPEAGLGIFVPAEWDQRIFGLLSHQNLVEA